jgi:hypothetical protein
MILFAEAQRNEAIKELSFSMYSDIHHLLQKLNQRIVNMMMEISPRF